MAKGLKPVSTQGQEGTLGGATPDASSGAEDELTLDALNARVQSLNDNIARLEKALQSDHDKGVNKVSKAQAKTQAQVDAFEDRLSRVAALMEDGLPQNLAIQWTRMQDGLAAPQSAEDETELEEPQAKPGQAAPPTFDEKFLAAIGMSQDDPDVLAIVRNGSQVTDLMDLVVRRHTGVPPTKAGVLPVGTGRGTESETAEALTEKLRILHQNPAANWKQIQEISAKLRPLLTNPR